MNRAIWSLASALPLTRIMMTRTSQPSASDPSRPVLLWVLRNDFDAITLGVEISDSGRCQVKTVPHWDTSLALVEPFDSAGDALRRHAEVASRLREIGWVVADHVPVTLAA
jgi:hypothetical protein